MDSMIIWTFVIGSAGSAFWWLRKQPLKDWILVYLLIAFLSALIDSFVVTYGWIDYPVRILPRVFDINVLFDFFVFPTLSVFHNQTSYSAKRTGIIGQAFLYSTPIMLLEILIVKYTHLIEYHKWNWAYTLLSLVATFLMVRFMIGVIRRYSD
jgi:hypothetical protein